MARAFTCLVLLSFAGTTFAQEEGASGLTAPGASRSAPSVDAVPATPTALPEASEPSAVPPPPTTTTYGTARYAAPQTEPVSTEGARISGPIATRLRALDGSLTNLAARGGSLLDGVLSMVSGGLSVGLGIYVHEEDTTLASYLYLWGVSGVARGVIDVALRPRASRPAIQFSHMPMTTPDEVNARLAFGETALQELARRARLSRILDASLSMATGILVVPIYLIPNDFSFEDPFDWFVLIGSSISVISGVINLATRSNAERRWHAYQELRARLESGERGVALRGGVTPVRGGAAGTIGFTF